METIPYSTQILVLLVVEQEAVLLLLEIPEVLVEV
jgi:hypothetical protein